MNLIPETHQAKSFQWLTDLIPEGRKQGISLEYLEKLTRRDRIKLKYDVLKARNAGILICSGNNGYYFPADKAELRAYTKRREQYIRTANAAIAPFIEAIKEW